MNRSNIMEAYKIYIEKSDFLIELEIIDEILQFQISDLQIIEDKYKNTFSFKKLIAKLEQLSYFAINIVDIKNELVEAIKKSLYVFTKVDFFALFSFEINKFQNVKKHFILELFLYKTDSRQATLMVTQLENKVNKVVNENIELQNSHLKLKNEIKYITIENTEIKNKIDFFQKELIDVINNKSLNLITMSKKIINEISCKLEKIKEELYSSMLYCRKSIALEFNQIPILRLEDKKNLTKWIGLDFDIEKIYDSFIDGDDLNILKLKTLNKQQTLILIDYDGRRFGVFISIPFIQKNIETYLIDDNLAFIFSLDKRRKFAISNLKYVSKCTSDEIIIGSGPDIYISNGFMNNNKNFSHILGSYGDGDLLEEGFTRNNYLAGSEYFKIRKLEIHQLIFK